MGKLQNISKMKLLNFFLFALSCVHAGSEITTVVTMNLQSNKAFTTASLGTTTSQGYKDEKEKVLKELKPALDNIVTNMASFGTVKLQATQTVTFTGREFPVGTPNGASTVKVIA